MKILITIENGKTTVEVDDQQPIKVMSGHDPISRFDFTNTPISEQSVGPSTGAAPVSNLLAPALEHAEQSLKNVGVAKDGTLRPERTCEICGDSIAHLHYKAKVCSDDCRRVKTNRYQTEQRKKLNPNAGSRTKDKDVGEGFWCKHCMAYTTHGTADHSRLANSQPLNLANHEPVETERRSKCCDGKVIVLENKSGESYYQCQACMNECEVYEYTPSFTDNWDCQACREGGRLCKMHEQMETEGQTYPKYRRES